VQGGAHNLQRNKYNMLLLERFLGLVAPHTCLGCEAEEDRLICAACQESVAPVPSRCYRCRAVTEDYAVCPACQSRTGLRRVAVRAHHAGLAKELIHYSKYERARSGLAEMAEAMAPLLPLFDETAVLVHIPTASSRVRVRGYDHARLMAAQLARNDSRTHATLLARVGQAHQVGANRTQRLRQLENAFRPLRPHLITGAHIILVDDVLTTGATLESAARVLKRAGAARVDAIVYAQPQ
jgi:ComF family protein